ncbi:MAG: NAD+ synthase, partial [Actinobacteria bacterium]|nr:NAD+ synthase [Actinomycetota bacterium]
AGVEGIVALAGFPERVERPQQAPPNPTIDPLVPSAHNSLALLAAGEVAGVYRKAHLPNYGVFDEGRYFEPGTDAALFDVAGALIGLTICEDIWVPGFPESAEVEAGARLVLNSSASPYARGKGDAREAMISARARENGAVFALCNTVGGQDELIFDGRSVVVAADGELIARAAQFEPELLLCDLLLPAADAPRGDSGSAVPLYRCERHRHNEERLEPRIAPTLSEEQEIYEALVLGVRDYVGKNGFGDVALGLSGGIDSALAAMIACDALGPERVHCVVMPSPHSSDETQSDARAIAANLGADAVELPIVEPMEAFERLLAPEFEGTEPGIAEENLQARIRGDLLMALSNKFGWLVLTTGNKSEMAVGYATLYGDMAGGLAVIKDVLKTWVYRLVEDRNQRAGRELVPSSVLERPPTAELRPDQLDEDSLPPYDLLDRILEAYVERDHGRARMVADGLPEDVVAEVIRLVDRAEYKRRQAPPGIRVSNKAFGRDRRLPITNRFSALRPRLPR